MLHFVPDLLPSWVQVLDVRRDPGYVGHDPGLDSSKFETLGEHTRATSLSIPPQYFQERTPGVHTVVDNDGIRLDILRALPDLLNGTVRDGAVLAKFREMVRESNATADRMTADLLEKEYDGCRQDWGDALVRQWSRGRTDGDKSEDEERAPRSFDWTVRVPGEVADLFEPDLQRPAPRNAKGGGPLPLPVPEARYMCANRSPRDGGGCLHWPAESLTYVYPVEGSKEPAGFYCADCLNDYLSQRRHGPTLAEVLKGSHPCPDPEPETSTS